MTSIMGLFADSTISELTQRHLSEVLSLNGVSAPMTDLGHHTLICTGCCTRLSYKYPCAFKDSDYPR